ncbi:nucleotidyltransferase domain-containing protein [Agrobacterium tumefaciens]|uniref:nucleotidyltransferase domain-containing protein n=1 Tax=Agrobacterium tumefaciens TaxID=358 RepID=UPI001573718B|nr:nucleotidyltransferase domain-containing protein [Agrobacterium tumefaciens]
MTASTVFPANRAAHGCQPPFSDEVRSYYQDKFAQNGLAIALAGSQALGYATSKSDIDLVLLAKPGSVLADKDQEYITDVVAGTRAEILVLVPETIERLLRHTRETGYKDLNYAQRRRIERLTTALPIVGASNWEKVLELFSRPDYQKQVLADNLVLASKSFDDLAGLVCDGDYTNAVDSMRFLLQVQMECLLCTYGDTGDRRRWLLRRMRLMDGFDPTVVDGFVDFNFNMINSKYSTLLEWLLQAFRFHQKVQCKVLMRNTFEFDCPIDTPTTVLTGRKYILSDFVFVLNIMDKWFVKSLESMHIIDLTSATILLMCSREVDANYLIDYFSNMSNPLFHAADAADAVNLRLAQLTDAGFLCAN